MSPASPARCGRTNSTKRRFSYLRTLLGYRKKRDTPVFLAALYLLTSNKEIGDRSFNCFTKGGIDFRYARRRGISQHDYTLLMGAKSLYCGTDEVTKGDLAEPQIVGDEAFRLLINALLIARYGEDALRIASQQGRREFIKRRAFRRGGFLPSAPLTGEVRTVAVFRVEKNHNYTVMSNYHLRDTALTLKAIGLLSKMLSLTDEWDYTTRGLAAICKEGVDAIGAALKELESHGYLVRRQLRDSRGRITDTEYTIYESPHPPLPDTACPDTGNPYLGTPDTWTEPIYGKARAIK